MTLHHVWVITDEQKAIGALCGGGRRLGGKVSAVVFGERAQAEEAIAAGADRVYAYRRPENGALIESYAASIAETMRAEKAELAMVYASVRGKLMAGRIASRLATSVFSNAAEITAAEGGVTMRRMVYGGMAMKTEQALSDAVVVTVGSGVFTALERDAARVGEVIEVNPDLEDSGIRVLETRPRQGEVINLSAAKRVVGVGRGFRTEGDLGVAADLAAAIGAELGCTRPIAEGEKWMSKERYIGVSGVMLKPDFYLSIGVSGQVQHMVGVNQAKTLAAINKDKNAPVFKQADFGLVGDIRKVLPQIVARLNA